MMELIWEFVNVDIDQPDAEPVQMQAYIDLHMLTHAVARRLYPGENGAADMAADAAALRDRIAKVKRSRHELVTLWHEAVAAADDATQRRSQSQRMAFDLEAKNVKAIAHAQAFAEQASYRLVVHALMAGSPADLRDPAVLARVCALHPDADRPAVRAPLEELPSAPKITMTALKKAARKMDVCSAAGPDCMPVLDVSGLKRYTTGDAGMDTGAKALLAFMQVYANGDLTPCVARCFGTARVCLHPQERGERRRRRVAAGCRDGPSKSCVPTRAPQGAAVRSGLHAAAPSLHSCCSGNGHPSARLPREA
jgi:hypothetical protein